MIFVPFIVLVSVIAFSWSLWKYGRVVDGLDYFPQYEDRFRSRLAVPEFALSPATPLNLQLEYVQSLMGGCIFIFCMSLICFLYENPFGGWLFIGIFFIGAASTLKYWMKYRANVNRKKAVRNEEEEL